MFCNVSAILITMILLKVIMKKILIFGNSGSGKSTLAKKLKMSLGLQHLDLDILAWDDTQPPTRKALGKSSSLLDIFMSKHNSWVIEGCYSDLLTYVSNKANEMIFLNPGNEICIERCKAREWEPHKYESKNAQDKNLDMLMEWVNDYDDREDETSLKSHQFLFLSFLGKKTEVRNNDEYIVDL